MRLSPEEDAVSRRAVVVVGGTISVLGSIGGNIFAQTRVGRKKCPEKI
jgi:hypothetical protein